jgi:sec-independent protein translocase protein TatA
VNNCISIWLNFATYTTKKTAVMGKLGPTEIILILAIVLLLFGGKKIPELMKGMGKGVKSFKDGMKEEDQEPKSDTNTGK